MTTYTLIAVLCVQTPMFGSGGYRLDIIAQTGDMTTMGSTITGLGTGPSINDAGQVAYKVGTADGRQWVLVSKERGARSALVESFQVGSVTVGGLSRNFYFDDVLEINNQNRVAWRVWSRDGLFSFIFRLGPSAADFKIVANTRYTRIDPPPLDMPSPFSGPFPFPTNGLYPWVTLNNQGRTVFSGVLWPEGTHTVLATPRNPETSGLTSASDYYFSGSASGAPDLFPVITDDDYVLVRAGGAASDPLILFDSPQFTAYWPIAEAPDFTSIGEQSGVSDDSVLIAFSGIRSSSGIGVYGDAGAGVFKIAGISGDGRHDPGETYVDSNSNGRIDPGEDSGPFSAFYPQPRVAVNRSGNGTPRSYTAAFLASRVNSGTAGLGPIGLYAVEVDVSNQAAPTFSEPRLVVETKQSMIGLPGTIDNIALYDPINNQGQIAFWVSSTTGSQAILRTAVPRLESFDANHGFSLVEFPLDLSTEAYLPQLVDFEPVGFGANEAEQVHAVAADGVTLLFLRVTIPWAAEGNVTFTLDSSTEGPLDPVGTIWSIEDVSLINGNDMRGDWDLEAPAGNATVSVPTFQHDGKTYAFALYRAPRDFDKDELEDPYQPFPWTRLREITIRAQFSPRSRSADSNLELAKNISVVRPPVLLVHGTWDSPRGWDDFPLWSQSANETNGFTSVGDLPDYPFTTFRLDYEVNNAGRLETNARLILPQIEAAIDTFRTCGAFEEAEVYRVAATQADVVTHSYGGPIIRKASQLQSYPHPVQTDTSLTDGRCFRTNYNWGYGYIHKFITLSGTHKGSQMAPHTAKVNAATGGELNRLAIERDTTGWPIPLPLFASHNRIDGGALRDQNVVSPALQSLLIATYPSHAVVGSGLYENSVPGNISTFGIPLEQGPFITFWYVMYGDPRKASYELSDEELDRRNGPYARGAGDNAPWPIVISMTDGQKETVRRLVNYVFNFSHDLGAKREIGNPQPWPEGDAPNYDLTARLSSMRGGLEGDAITDVRHLAPDGSVSNAFVGQLTHLTEIGTSPPAVALAEKIAFLLRQSTTSKHFSRFPAVKDIIDEYDRVMMNNFPQEQVKNDLEVHPPDLEVPPYFEDEAKRRLDKGENGLSIIRNP